MRPVEVSRFIVGWKLTQPVKLENGIILLNAGTILTQSYLERLKKLKISHVFAEQNGENHDLPPFSSDGDIPLLSTDSYVKDFGLSLQNKIISILHSEKANMWFSDPMKEKLFIEFIRPILHDITHNEEIVSLLIKLQYTDEMLFHHSVYVALLSSIIGMEKGYSYKDIKELLIGAILSDIGMTMLPKEIIQKPGKLSEMERRQLQEHVQIGYDMIKDIKSIPIRSKNCVMQHHERYNGSGYPMQLKAGEIDEFAQIVAIADVFIALISSRHHRNPYTRNEVVEFMFAAGNELFSFGLVRILLNSISIYPVSTQVVLNNGLVGIVTAINHDLKHRPIVKVIRSKDGTNLDVPYEINLKYNAHLYIQS